MNREQTIEAIKVMQAWVDGADVEFLVAGETSWECCYDPTWHWYGADYRIKQKPMRKYVVLGCHGEAYTYDSAESAAEQWPSGPFLNCDWHGWMVEETKE